MTEEHTITVHKKAAETLAEMDLQAQAVLNMWKGIDTELATAGIVSLARQTTQLFNMFFGNNSRITRDGELCLFVSTGTGFVFGVIFHPKHYRVDPPLEGDVRLYTKVPREGRYCMLSTEAGYCAKPLSQGKRTCDHQDADPIYILPIPGEWSFHS
jgi:hypothetical protein